MKLGIIILYVSDLQKSKQFYTEILGLPVIEEQSSPVFVALQPSEGPTLGLEDLTVVPPGQARPAGSLEIGFAVDDVDLTWRRWKDCGVTMVTDPEDMPFGRAFLAKDPDGHLLTIYRLNSN